MLFLLFALFCACKALPTQTTSDSVRGISVSFNFTSRKFDVLDVADENGDAFGYYYTNYNQSGWQYLDVFMYTEIDSVSEHLQYSRAMGYLEVLIFNMTFKINSFSNLGLCNLPRY